MAHLPMWSMTLSGLSMPWLTHPVRLLVCVGASGVERRRARGEGQRDAVAGVARGADREADLEALERVEVAQGPLLAVLWDRRGGRGACGRRRGRREGRRRHVWRWGGGRAERVLG